MDVWLLLDPDHGKEMAAWLGKEKGCHAVAKALFFGVPFSPVQCVSAKTGLSEPNRDLPE